MADEQSIWKKEISFGRKRKDQDPGPEVTEAGDAPTGGEPTSIWKKELSLGRKKKPAAAAEPATDAEAPVQGSDPQTGPEEPAADEPMWTRAVSFSPSPGAEEGATEEPATDVNVVELPVVAAEPETVTAAEAPVEGSDPQAGSAEPAAEGPMWTREVSLSANPSSEQPAREEPTADENVVEPAVVAAEPEPVIAAEAPVQGSDPETGPEGPAAEEATWTRAVSFSPNAEPDPEPSYEEPPTTQVEEPEPAPVVAEAVPETWSAQPSLPPEPEPVPAPEVPMHVPAATASAPVSLPPPSPGVHAPVTADELPPVAEDEKKVPFWKKDLSFGGGKKKEPKAKQPKQPKEKKQKEPKAAKAPKEPKAPKVKVPRGSKGGKRLVGLKIGASQVAAARVANNGSAELLQVAREPLEPGIVVGGELRDPDSLAEALKAFFAKHNLPKKGVRLGIANNRIGVRTFDVAGMGDQKQLANAVRFRAQEALPIPIDEAVLDFQVLGEGVDEQGQPTKRILLVVAYRELIDRYLDACKKAGITLVGIDLEAFALLRALQAPRAGDEGEPDAALVAVSIGHDRSTFAVSDGRVCEFTRVLEWGGAALNVAIARALDAAPSEVDDVKRALALTDEMVPDGLSAEQAQKARDSMRRAIQTFARELVSSLQYYQNQPGSLGIGEIVLTGGTAHLHGLAGELEKLIGVRVRVGDPLARMKVSKKLGETEQVGSLAVAIGLGIED
jgi:type IV pilus assembly protein PilM